MIGSTDQREMEETINTQTVASKHIHLHRAEEKDRENPRTRKKEETTGWNNSKNRNKNCKQQKQKIEMLEKPNECSILNLLDDSVPEKNC